MTNNIITVPNIISLFRLLLTWPLAYCIYYDYSYRVVLFGLTAIISDYLDGYFSRILRQRSSFGKALDPIADAVLVMTVIAVLWMKQRIPYWYLQLVVVRYLVVIFTLCIYRLKTKEMPSSLPLGKLSMVLMSLCLLTAWLQNYIPLIASFFLYLSTFTLVVSMFDYLYFFGYERL